MYMNSEIQKSHVALQMKSIEESIGNGEKGEHKSTKSLAWGRDFRRKSRRPLGKSSKREACADGAAVGVGCDIDGYLLAQGTMLGVSACVEMLTNCVQDDSCWIIGIKSNSHFCFTLFISFLADHCKEINI